MCRLRLALSVVAIANLKRKRITFSLSSNCVVVAGAIVVTPQQTDSPVETGLAQRLPRPRLRLAEPRLELRPAPLDRTQVGRVRRQVQQPGPGQPDRLAHSQRRLFRLVGSGTRKTLAALPETTLRHVVVKPDKVFPQGGRPARIKALSAGWRTAFFPVGLRLDRRHARRSVRKSASAVAPIEI